MALRLRSNEHGFLGCQFSIQIGKIKLTYQGESNMKINFKTFLVAVAALGFLSSCGHFMHGGHKCEKCSQEQKQMCETCKKAASTDGAKKEECAECKKGS